MTKFRIRYFNVTETTARTIREGLSKLEPLLEVSPDPEGLDIDVWADANGLVTNIYPSKAPLNVLSLNFTDAAALPSKVITHSHGGFLTIGYGTKPIYDVFNFHYAPKPNAKPNDGA